MGLDYSFQPIKGEFVKILKQVADILKAEVTRNPDKQVILRSTLPQHFPGNDGYYEKQKKENHMYEQCDHTSTLKEHFSNKHLKNTAEQFGFKYMDSFPIYMDRWDLHWKLGDCTHNCYTEETAVPELALLNRLLN